MRVFETEVAYLNELESNPGLAVVSMAMAARARSVSRSAVERMLRVRQLDGLQIGDVRCVLAKSLIDWHKRDEQNITTVRRVIESYARRGETLFYEPVMSALGLSHRIPAHRSQIGGILASVSIQTDEEEKFLLSAIVHKKAAGQTKPGVGFFVLAKERNYSFDDKDVFVEQQKKKIFRHYGAQGK